VALKRKEEAERLKKIVIVQPVTPEKELKKSPIPTVAITEVDVSTTGDKKDLKEPAHGSLDDRKDSTITGDKKDATTTLKKSTSKPPAPKPMFNYAKAIGMPPSAKKTVKKPSAAVSDSSSIEPKADTGDVSSGEVALSENTSVEVPRSGDGDAPLVTKATPQGSLMPAGKSDNVSNEVKANNGDVNSEGQTGRVSSENADELGDTKLDGAAPLETKPADSVNQSNLPPTEVESGVAENLTSEAEEANKDGTDSEAQAVRESAEEVGSSGNSTLESSAVESLMIAPAGNAPRGQVLQLSIRSFPSGPISLKSMKARVKRTLSRVSSRRSSSRVARSDSLTRTPPPVPVVWVQEAVRRALSNVKECYGLNPSTVNH
jgi:hypothetical protein